MTKKVLGLILGLGLLAAPSVMAEELGPGCGLGKVIFDGKKGLVSHTVAWTSNGFFASQLLGITSGTSGCDADQVIQRDKEQEVFVAANLDNLSQEMAQGHGAYLDSLAGLMGCTGAASGAFASLTQQKYEVLFASAEPAPAALLSGLKREMAAHPSLAAGCSRISS